MDIGDVRRAVISGQLARRKGWNGKGMHVYAEDSHTDRTKGGIYAGSSRTYERHLVLFTAHGTHQSGWVCSQADFFADDWEVTVGGHWPATE